jgi:Ca-activated chloride channel family protein
MCDRLLHIVGVAFLLALCASQFSWGQLTRLERHDEVPDSELLPTISKFVDEVPLNFIVTDAHGKFVRSLGEHDFNLLDTGRPPERISHFRARTDSPLRVTLLFDLSSSIRDRLDFEKKAAKHFVKDILRPQVDQADVISFANEVREIQSMTGDVDKLVSAVSHLKAEGDTALYDAIVHASEDLRATRSDEARNVIIIVSDGADTASHSSEKQCEKAVIASEATILVVDASVPSERNSPGQQFLYALVEHSGGLVLPAREDWELKSAFRMIEGALRSQYVLSYKPAALERNGAYRFIELNARKRGLKVHCRKGYYALPN